MHGALVVVTVLEVWAELAARVVDVTVLGLVGGAPGGETPRVADSSAAGAGRFFHNSVPPSFVSFVPVSNILDFERALPLHI